MAKRRGKRKSESEAQIERITWFLLVLIFAIVSILPEETIPNWIIPGSGAFILLGAGIYQTVRRWHVSPITWVAGTLMFVLAVINLYVNPDQDFLGFTLLTFAAVIGFGVLTGET
ncbi:MAG: hypothetical protein RLP44_13775 [Aggregatilineales bacterium]